jgi:uncharacterized protein (DUF2147 family)
LLNTLHFATALALITGSTANAATVLDTYISAALAQLRSADCGDARHGHGRASCAKHKVVVKKSLGASAFKRLDSKSTSKPAAPKVYESASVTGVDRRTNPIMSPIGEWNADDRRIRIDRCGQALCGIVTTAKTPGDTDRYNPDTSQRDRPVIGMPVLIDMMPADTNRWDGRIYNTKDGRIYSANILLKNANLLQVEGVAPHALLLQNWMRAGADDPLAGSTRGSNN